MAVFINTRLCFLSTPCTRVLSKQWRSYSKYTKISSQVKKLRADRDVPLSPEQLDRIARSKAAALERLSSRRGPVGVGESWRRALEAEFNKPYFTSVIRLFSFPRLRFFSFFFLLVMCIFPQLMNFVDGERQKHTVYPPQEQVFTWTQMCQIEDVSFFPFALHTY